MVHDSFLARSKFNRFTQRVVGNLSKNEIPVAVGSRRSQGVTFFRVQD